MKSFPLFLDVKDKAILVFGGGRDAAAKLRLVLKTEADLYVIAQDLVPSEIQLGTAQHIQADPLTCDLPANVVFAYAATGDEDLDAAIAKRLRDHGILVCAADQPEVSDFSTAAMVDRDPVVVAIGTEGTAPVLARQIKAQVESLLPETLGKTAKLALTQRRWVAKHLPSGRPRRLFWKRFFQVAPQSVREAFKTSESLAKETHKPMGHFSLLPQTPKQVGSLSLDTAKVLDEADVVFHHFDAPKPILERARREAVLVPFYQGEQKPLGAGDIPSLDKAVSLAKAYLKEQADILWLSPSTQTLPQLDVPVDQFTALPVLSLNPTAGEVISADPAPHQILVNYPKLNSAQQPSAFQGASA